MLADVPGYEDFTFNIIFLAILFIEVEVFRNLGDHIIRA